jgi:RNA polymerase sigma factor (TIGR02999 family)
LLRPNLCAEAIRLGRLVHGLFPEQAEAAGLLALMLLHESRREARTDADGALVVLEDQVRSSWDRVLITEATAILDGALLQRRPGPYQIQAAIAALHAHAPTAAETDWLQIYALYGALLRHMPTPVVELNAAVALAMTTSIKEGLQWIDRNEQSDEAYLRLVGGARVNIDDHVHFVALASRIMRQVLVDHARARLANKRQGGLRVTLSEAQEVAVQSELDVIAIDEALMRLAEFDEQQAHVVELRYFGGLSIVDTALALGISAATVKRDWTMARTWLRSELRSSSP